MPMTVTESRADSNLTEEARVDQLLEELLAEWPPATTGAVEFLGAQFDKGLAWVQFPEGRGGLGLSPKLQSRISLRIIEAGGPDPFSRNPIGVGMCAPTLIEWGSEAQIERYLRPLFTSEEIWCQLFSEPGSGSDFAGLSSRAVRDGDEWLINGQKVWTTLGHLSRWGLLVSRTDPEAVKHAGLTAFVVDMQAPGVDVRPLRQMTGEAEFNEVYFADARIPMSEMLGQPGDGWRVSLTTLMNERVSIGGAVAPRGAGPIAVALELWNALPDDERDPVLRDDLMRLWIRAEVARLTNLRAAGNRKTGTPGPEGSVGKLAHAEDNKDIYEFCITLLGAEGMLYESYEMVRPGIGELGHRSPAKAFLRSRANSIEGGTSEVMKNIMGERVLGLPGDVRVDRDVPWSQVPRN
jgi:alkylation response protein AidB-like acyl-CoA dehydrogenase